VRLGYEGLVKATTSTPTLAGVREQLQQLLAQGQQEELLTLVMNLLEQLTTENTQLQWRLQAALRQLYRKKSERVSPDQLLLWLAQVPAAEAAAAHVETAAPELSTAEPATTPGGDSPPVPSGKGPRVRPVRRPLPAHLRREVRIIEPTAEQLRCAQCGTQREPMGVDVRETLEFRPAELFVVQEQLVKCVCKHCQEGVVTGTPSPRPLEGARPGPGLLAQLLIAKYEDSQPLHRQMQQWHRLGVDLAASTLGDWTAGAIDLLEPLWKAAKQDTLRRSLVSVDDTPLPVLDRDHPAGIKKGHLWAYLGDREQVLFCEYTPTWEGVGPRTVLKDFKGYLQSDGYAGLDALFRGPDPPTRLGCLAHARRRFVQALDAKDLRAAVPLELFRQLYHIEAQARQDHADTAEVHRRRQALSRPVLTRLHQVIQNLHGQAVPKSPLGKATGYALNQWATLTVYLDDGALPIDNMHVERRHRKVALGRHNYLFCGSDEGARRHAIISTVLGNCALSGVEPGAYLRDVLTKLAGDWPQARLHELLPRPWAAAQQQPQHAEAQQLLAS
jgi:transposase